ncbi:hypothetical protein C8Q78DRAFT_424524 [Trametes maxima]|nr:hypothetical protein C8Q78DRAFT_424524 [Trametes maxima]
MGALHLSCLILFFKRWSNKRTGHSPEQDQDLDYIQRCIRLIETSRIESAMAERLLESISAILAADPSSAASSARKQDHKPDVEVEARTANVSASDTVCTDSNDVPSGDSRNGKVLDAEASYNPSVFTFPQGSLPSSEQPNTGFFDMPPGHIENNATGFGMDIDAPFTLPLHMEELCRVPTGSFGTLPVPGWAAPHSADGQAPQSATTQGLPFDYYSFLQQSGMYSGEGQGFGHAGPSHEYGMQEGGSTGYMGGSVEGGSHQLPHDLPSFSIDFSSLDMPPLEDHTFGATEGEASDELRDILGPFR